MGSAIVLRSADIQSSGAVRVVGAYTPRDMCELCYRRIDAVKMPLGTHVICNQCLLMLRVWPRCKGCGHPIDCPVDSPLAAFLDLYCNSCAKVEVST